jgi:hypothetical protein
VTLRTSTQSYTHMTCPSMCMYSKGRPICADSCTRVAVVPRPDWHYWKRAYTYWTVIISTFVRAFSVFFLRISQYLLNPPNDNRQNLFLNASTLIHRYLFYDARERGKEITYYIDTR